MFSCRSNKNHTINGTKVAEISPQQQPQQEEKDEGGGDSNGNHQPVCRNSYWKTDSALNCANKLNSNVVGYGCCCHCLPCWCICNAWVMLNGIHIICNNDDGDGATVSAAATAAAIADYTVIVIGCVNCCYCCCSCYSIPFTRKHISMNSQIRDWGMPINGCLCTMEQIRTSNDDDDDALKRRPADFQQIQKQ